MDFSGNLPFPCYKWVPAALAEADVSVSKQKHTLSGQTLILTDIKARPALNRIQGLTRIVPKAPQAEALSCLLPSGCRKVLLLQLRQLAVVSVLVCIQSVGADFSIC